MFGRIFLTLSESRSFTLWPTYSLHQTEQHVHKHKIVELHNFHNFFIAKNWINLSVQKKSSQTFFCSWFRIKLFFSRLEKKLVVKINSFFCICVVDKKKAKCRNSLKICESYAYWMPRKPKPTTTFAMYAKNSASSLVLIGHQITNDWHFHCSRLPGKDLFSFFCIFVVIFAVPLAVQSWFSFVLLSFIRCNCSDAAAAKDGLSKKGYHVDYAKAKPSPGIGGGDGDGGRVKREEFRSTHTLNGGGHNGSENGGDNGAHVINDNESMDNR